MRRIVYFCCSFALLSLLAIAEAWAQAEQANPPGLNIRQDSAGQVMVQTPPPLKLERQYYGPIEVLSDTLGVDFRPYLQNTVLPAVRSNWYSLIPESAKQKKGKVAIEFALTKAGKVAGMKLVTSSGDVTLDRSAWGGIVASDPFPSLPVEFKGEYLALRFRFFYNPDAADIAPENSTAPASPIIHALVQAIPEKLADNGVSALALAPPTLCFPQPKTQTRVDAEVTNNQEGVGLVSYLEHSVLPVIRANWYRLVSKSGGRESGQLTVEFNIQKDGKLGPSKVTDSSGNAGISKLALEGIEKSGPFPGLPADFSGQFLGVRSHFRYDPDNNARSSSSRNGDASHTASSILPICNPNQPAQNKGDCLSPPRVIYHPDPTLSPQSKYQGSVMLFAIVAADGSVQSACAMQSLDNRLDKQAVDAVRTWKFEPATLDGKSMAAEIMIEVDFHLYDKAAAPIP